VSFSIDGTASAPLNCNGVDERMTGGGSIFVIPDTANPNNEVVISGMVDPTRVVARPVYLEVVVLGRGGRRSRVG
jgi:hypothetical protein